jgi:hypothetical protein
MSSEPPASNVDRVNEAWLRRRPSRGDIALIAITGLVGAVAGGWLDYNTLSDNDAVRALAVRFVAIVVAIVAGVVWSRRHGHRATVVALASAAFFAGSLIGGWIAPSIHPAGWSQGSARVELRGGLSRTDTLAVDCSSVLDGALLSISNMTQARAPGIATDSLWLSLTIQAEAPLNGGPVPASTAFYLGVGTGVPGSGQDFEYNPEAGTSTISAEGTPQRGQLTFEKLPAVVGGYLGLPNNLPTLSGVIDWTCQPASKEPTPVEGSWFH